MSNVQFTEADNVEQFYSFVEEESTDGNDEMSCSQILNQQEMSVVNSAIYYSTNQMRTSDGDKNNTVALKQHKIVTTNCSSNSNMQNCLISPPHLRPLVQCTKLFDRSLTLKNYLSPVKEKATVFSRKNSSDRSTYDSASNVSVEEDLPVSAK